MSSNKQWNEGFLDGVIGTLAVLKSDLETDSNLYREIVGAMGPEDVIARARATRQMRISGLDIYVRNNGPFPRARSKRAPQ